MAEELLFDGLHPMYNRLQHYLHLPNIAPARRPAPVVKMAEPPAPVHFNPARPDVALRAYYIFLNQGGHHGFDLDHWLEAESQLFAEHNAVLKKNQSAPAKK